MVCFVVVIQFVEGKGRYLLSIGSCSMHQNHRMVGREKIHQSQLDAAGQVAPIQLPHQGRLVRVHERMMKGGQFGSVR